VAARDWYAGYAAYLQSFNVLAGYPDGTFGGDSAITRAEFITMAARFHEALRFEPVTGSESNPAFPDVYGSYWAVTYINAAAENRWVSGYPDGTFAPDKAITRAEVVAVVNRLLGRVPDRVYIDGNLNKLSNFPDLKKRTGPIMTFWRPPTATR
jgi:hypothetical protein